MTRKLAIALLTLGDPGRLTGGYLFHLRMAERAARFDAQIDFVSFPDVQFPLAALAAPRALERARRTGAVVLVLDSIAAAYLAVWSAIKPLDLPLVAMLHQPPGGIDYGPPRLWVQRWLDKLAYRRVGRFLVASESLADELIADGVPAGRLRVVPPGRDVAPAPGPPVGDLRRGRQAAYLCVGNWVARKGIHSLLAAFSRLPHDLATLHLVGD